MALGCSVRRVLVCTALLAGLTAVGCGSPGTPQPSAAAPTGQTAAAGQSGSAGPAGSASVPPSAGAVLVEFGRQGGIAGLSDQLVVHDDGRFTLMRSRPPGSRSGQLTPTELADLRDVLERSGFAGLPAVESADGNDLFTYHVVYANRQILAQDGGVAEPLKPVIGALTAIVQKYGS